MELYRNGLKLTATIGLDESRGSVNVPVRLLHNEKDEYLNYTEQIHIRYLLDNQVKEEILPTNDTGFYIPGKPLSHDGPIELAVHLINGDIELVTNELSFVVKNAPNGTTQVDPSEFTWQQLVDQYVNAKLETFADKADMNKFKDDVNANLSNQDKKITDLQNTTKVSLDSQNTKIDNFKSEVNTSLSNQNTSINQTTSAQNSKITTLEGRMDTFTRLSEGSTTGDAELQDIRVGANGTTYDTAGDAVRGQYSQLKEDLGKLSDEIDEYDKYLNAKKCYLNFNNFGNENKCYFSPTNIQTPTSEDEYRIAEPIILHSGTYTFYKLDTHFCHYVDSTGAHKLSDKYIGLTTLIKKFEETVMVYCSTKAIDGAGCMIVDGDIPNQMVNVGIYDSILESMSKNISDIRLDIGDTNSKRQTTSSPLSNFQIDLDLNIKSGDVVVFDVKYSGLFERVVNFYYFDSDGNFTSILNTNGKNAFKVNNKYAFIADKDYVKVRCTTSSIQSGETEVIDVDFTCTTYGDILSKVYAEMLENNETLNKKNYNIITVGKKGCDYDNLQDAIDNCNDSIDNPIVIKVMPGEYQPFSMTDKLNVLRYISIIGYDRSSTIIKNTVANYFHPAAEIRTTGTIENLSFITECTEPYDETETKHLFVYAVHSDFGGNGKTIYKNCYFYSNGGPAIGIGLHQNETLEFYNCKFVSNCDGTHGLANVGVFFAHTALEPNKINQKLVLDNCLIIDELNSKSLVLTEASRYGVDTSGCTYEYIIRNTQAYNQSGAKADIDDGIPKNYWFGNNF